MTTYSFHSLTKLQFIFICINSFLKWHTELRIPLLERQEEETHNKHSFRYCSFHSCKCQKEALTEHLSTDSRKRLVESVACQRHGQKHLTSADGGSQSAYHQQHYAKKEISYLVSLWLPLSFLKPSFSSLLLPLFFSLPHQICMISFSLGACVWPRHLTVNGSPKHFLILSFCPN